MSSDNEYEFGSGVELDKQEENKNNKVKKTRVRSEFNLNRFYTHDVNMLEIGADEAGRGPLFGRVYSAAVILPKDDSFDHSKMKDSKKFHSKKQIDEAADYIKKNALAWYVSFEDEKVIDEINILQATQKAMHSAILETRKQYNDVMKKQNKKEANDYSFYLLIDGNYFNPIIHFNKTANKLETLPYSCIEGGDNKYTAIAAASILAKVERDKYIEDLCKEHPELIEKYGIDQNKGYGAKRHLDGIKEHGITIWHRRSFGICKTFSL
uniref:Ribonuclease HII n=1 Tax=viral metagenome TaxID=1070528 RepID=A0A6C0JHH2_9ZZZZ